MAGEGSVSDRQLHPWLAAVPLAPNVLPGRDMAELTTGLAGRSPEGRGIGHDAIDRMRATRKIAEAAGMPKGWGVCRVCHGHAIHPDDLEASEAWEGTEPPTGPGWQLWETTSEGSPVSPVFDSPEELAEWCEGNATWFGRSRWTAAEWLASFDAGTTDVDSLLMLRDGRLGSAKIS
jgi:hypothetical protein